MRAVVCALAAALLCAPAAFAQRGPGGVAPRPIDPVTKRPVLLKDVRFDQQLDAQVPADLSFRDDLGNAVQLGEYFGKRPIVLALVYFECPMLCSQVLTDLVSALGVLQPQRRARTSTSSPSASTRSEGAGARGGEEGGLRRALRPAGHRARASTSSPGPRRRSRS